MTKLLVLIAMLLGTGVAAADDAAQPFLQRPPGNPLDARAACVEALQKDSTFAAWVLEKGYQVQSARCADFDEPSAKRRLDLDLGQHEAAAARIRTNERHVVLAYAAMWLVAAAFVIFLWLRQRALRSEIEQLRRELEAAIRANP